MKIPFSQKSSFFYLIVGFLYVLIVGFSFYLLYLSKTSIHLFTPWQTIRPAYIYIFFAATGILGFLTLSNLKPKIILFLLIVQTLLMHSFLPLTHEFFYGADNWRHIAVEERILHGEPFLRPQITDAAHQSSIQKLDPGELSYWHFWGLTVAVTKIFHSDLITVNKWLGPLVWSLVFPLLLYQLGITLGWSKRRSLFFVWLGFLPFAWIAGGSWTLPNNLGFLWYLAMVIILLRRLQYKNTPPCPPRGGILGVPFKGGFGRWYVPFLLGMGILSFFGYILFAILFWMSWVGVEIIRRLKDKEQGKLLAGLGIAGSFAIPLAEWMAGYSHFDPQHNFLGSIKVLFKNIIGWFVARGPYPGNPGKWNIIFNQVSERAFVPNLFIAWRWWLLPVICGITALSLYGWWKCITSSEKKWQWFGGMYVALFGSYICSRYFLTGENILARRLDMVLVLLVMVTLFVGLQNIFERIVMYRRDAPAGRLYQVAGILFFSILIATSYSLGPDTDVVTGNEYKAMQHVWNEIKQEHPPRPPQGGIPACVLADTHPLVALEALSHREIIGGGFPINQYFAQPERVKLFASTTLDASDTWWREAISVTSAWNKGEIKECWFVAQKKQFHMNDYARSHMNDMQFFGDVVVWKYSF